MQRPTDSDVITLKYGATSSPYSATNPHAGVDYRAPTGANIYAPHAGKVTQATTMGDCGKAVEIDGGRFKSRLCHNSAYKVSVGTQVSEGQLVALAGATGAAVGAHCHWILWDNGVRVDGSRYVNEGGSMATEAEILRSALNAREKTIAILESALNARDNTIGILESALNAERERIKQLQEGLAKEGEVLEPGKYLVK